MALPSSVNGAECLVPSSLASNTNESRMIALQLKAMELISDVDVFSNMRFLLLMLLLLLLFLLYLLNRQPQALCVTELCWQLPCVIANVAAGVLCCEEDVVACRLSELLVEPEPEPALAPPLTSAALMPPAKELTLTTGWCCVTMPLMEMPFAPLLPFSSPPLCVASQSTRRCLSIRIFSSFCG